MEDFSIEQLSERLNLRARLLFGSAAGDARTLQVDRESPSRPQPVSSQKIGNYSMEATDVARGWHALLA
jgi:hypothetical protein